MGILLAVLLIGGSVHQAVHLGGVCQLHLEHPPICEGVAVDLQAQELQLSASTSICELQTCMAVTSIICCRMQLRTWHATPKRQQAAAILESLFVAPQLKLGISVRRQCAIEHRQHELTLPGSSASP